MIIYEQRWVGPGQDTQAMAFSAGLCAFCYRSFDTEGRSWLPAFSR
jgi:hypothetical protein